MVKKLEQQWRLWWRSQLYKNNNNFFIKLGVSVLLVGLAFSLIYNRSSDSSVISGDPFLENTVSTDSEEITDHIPSKGQIFIFLFFYSFCIMLLMCKSVFDLGSLITRLLKLFLAC